MLWALICDPQQIERGPLRPFPCRLTTAMVATSYRPNSTFEAGSQSCTSRSLAGRMGTLDTELDARQRALDERAIRSMARSSAHWDERLRRSNYVQQRTGERFRYAARNSCAKIRVRLPSSMALIAAGIAVAIIAVVQATGSSLNTTFTSVSTALK
jgi:Flp/Fap pilin component